MINYEGGITEFSAQAEGAVAADGNWFEMPHPNFLVIVSFIAKCSLLTGEVGRFQV